MEQFFTTSSAFSAQVEKPSIHPVNVSIMTNRYLYPQETGIWVRSISQSSLGWVPHRWTGWASWGLWAPWGLFNWQVRQDNLWRAFSPKWVVAFKELTNFHWRFPGRKRSLSFWNHPIWSSWKPSLLALRVSPWGYEGVSGKLVCGTKVETPITSLFL